MSIFEDVINAMNPKTISFPGASGVIKFCATGNRLPDTKMMVMQGRKMVEVK